MDKEILKINKENSIFPKGERGYLVFPDKNLVPGTLSEDEDFFELELDTDGLTSASSFIKGQGPDKYRFLIACGGLEGLRGKYSFSLDPENLMYDASFTPKVRLRDGAKPGGIPFAEEYKALIASVIAPKNTFADYRNGGADLYGTNKLLCELAPMNDTEEIAGNLKSALSELEGKLAKDSILIDKSRYKVVMALMIVFICLFGALAAFSVRYYMVDVKAKDIAIEVSDKFLARDYVGVLLAAGNKELAALSKEERYMAAYSGASVASLSGKQREAVMKGIALNTDSLYLDYWIDIGLGDYEDALDISRRMGDSELELYALVVYRDAVSININMTGEEKAGTLKTLDDQIAALRKMVEEANAGGGNE